MTKAQEILKSDIEKINDETDVQSVPFSCKRNRTRKKVLVKDGHRPFIYP